MVIPELVAAEPDGGADPRAEGNAEARLMYHAAQHTTPPGTDGDAGYNSDRKRHGLYMW
jgi:hypothetical protein